MAIMFRFLIVAVPNSNFYYGNPDPLNGRVLFIDNVWYGERCQAINAGNLQIAGRQYQYSHWEDIKVVLETKDDSGNLVPEAAHSIGILK